MYKAKQNISSGDKDFVSGKIYSAEEVEGADLSNFEVIGGEEKKTEVESTNTETQGQSGANDDEGKEVLE